MKKNVIPKSVNNFNYKILKTFRILSEEELRRVKKMFQSPFFTTNENLLKLFNFLRKFYPEMNSEKLDKEIIFFHVFNQKKFSSAKFRNLCTDFVRMIEDFLLYERSTQEKTKRDLILLSIFEKRTAGDLYVELEKKLLKSKENSVYRDSDYKREALELNRIRLDFLSSNDLELRDAILRESAYLNKGLYLLNDKRVAIDLNSISKYLKNDPVTEPNPEVENEVIKLYVEIEKVNDIQSPKKLREIKDLFFSNFHKMHKVYGLELLQVLLNRIVNLMYSDDKVFNTLITEVYQEADEAELLIVNGVMTDVTFFNVVTSASKEGEFEWTKKFISKNKQYLQSPTKEGTVLLSLAQLFFYEKKFEEALVLLQGADIKLNSQNYVAKAHFIRCGYEYFLTNDTYYDKLLKNIEAFQRWSRRNPDYKNFQAMLNFLSMVRRITNEKTLGKLSSKQKIDLRTRLDGFSYIVSRQWLSEKINQG